MNNTRLALVAIVLLGLSVFTYVQSVTRAERFERGQKFLSQLNADNIYQIIIEKGGETTTLERGEDKFTVAEANGYPAKNDAINRLISDMIGVGLEKPIGTSDSLAEELQINPDHAEAIKLTFKNDSGKVMVETMIGKTSEDGRGRYVRRLDGDDDQIYLTSNSLFISTDKGNFLDKQILDVASTQLASITGANFSMTTAENGVLKLEEIPAGKEENPTEVDKVKNALQRLNFDKVFLADESEVSGLTFDNSVVYKLDDNSSYTVQTSKKGERYFLKIRAAFDVERIELSREDTDEELEGKSKILERSEEVRTFNEFHGSWVYEVTEPIAQKFRVSKAELLKDQEEDS